MEIRILGAHNLESAETKLTSILEVTFLVDINAVKLARWLRLLGYDAEVVPGADDNRLIALALKQGRVLLTRDTQIMLRRIVTTGKLKALLLHYDDPKQQLNHVVAAIGLSYNYGPFTRCLECNKPLINRSKEEVRGLVPPYVFDTQFEFKECSECKRVYWRGTHWQNMNREVQQLQAEVHL